MWSRTFAQRLEAWVVLRQQCQDLAPDLALRQINSWWSLSPWQPYHLHWDDQPTWPDPWQLLDDNIYCGLARGLGMLYTIAIVDRPDIQNAVLTEVGGDNLVQIGRGKYILNWDPDEIVNINLSRLKVRNSVSQEQIKQQIK
jgi:hypothetical protein